MLLGARTISLFGPHPVLLRTRPVGFPKNFALFGGIAGVHGFYQGTPFYFNRLSKIQAWDDRRNCLIII
jgi:hypothetical protein